MSTKLLLPLMLFALLIVSCNNRTGSTDNNEASTNVTNDTNTENTVVSGDWHSKYDRIDPTDLPDNVIDLIGKQWMLVTAGTSGSFNTMTASWGAVGYIWERPSTFIFIRDSRYTYQFLQREEGFTLSFFSEQYRGAMRICGTKSGRDTDKIKGAGLTTIETPSGFMSFAEARMIIECRKTFVQELDYANLTIPYKDMIMEESYNNEPTKHQLFISEITNIWLKK